MEEEHKSLWLRLLDKDKKPADMDGIQSAGSVLFCYNGSRPKQSADVYQLVAVFAQADLLGVLDLCPPAGVGEGSGDHHD